MAGNVMKKLAASLALLPTIYALSPDPGQGKMYLGAWPDLSEDGDYDTPAAINFRFGSNFPIFQLAQSIPLPEYNYTSGAGGPALFSEVDASATDAAYYVTVYPDTDDNLAAVQDSDIVALADQIAQYQHSGRTVFLRWAPEMNGPWKSYGIQPTAYKALWQRMYAIIKQLVPEVTIVWAPNTSYGYPSGLTLEEVESEEDRQLLDTNSDGTLTADDDAYAPYYPGDDYVDQTGMSLYYKGPGFQNINEAQPGGFCANLLEGSDPFYAQAYTPFYSTYCDEVERVCQLTESGAAYHVDVSSGSSQLEIQTAWIHDCLANSTFFDQFPWLRHIELFEHVKTEYDGGNEDLRDFRVTYDTDVVQVLKEAIHGLEDRYVWANSTLSDEDNDTAANSDIATTPASSPNVESTVVDTVTIASLSSQVVTATVTRLATPTYPGGMANDAGSSDGANRFRGHEDDDSGAVLLSVSLGCAVTTLLAFGIVFA